jgi:hypothetical protein
MRRVLTWMLAGLSLGGLSALTWASGAVAATDPDDPGFPAPTSPGDSGDFGGFGILVVLVVLVGVGITVYKVAMARDMARKSGMDPDQATAMTLLSDDGLDATYLASNLRRPTTQPTDQSAAEPVARTAAERLTELEGLREQGLVTREEYDARRTAILDSL